MIAYPSCSGATATLDLFLRCLEAHGSSLAIEIAEELQVDRIRSTVDEQTRAHRMAVLHRSEKLAAAIAAMEGNLDTPLGVDRLATRAGLTRRQLHRLFRHHTRMSPTRYYRDVRLRRARLMLLNTTAPIVEVAVATGFSTHSTSPNAIASASASRPAMTGEPTQGGPSSSQGSPMRVMIHNDKAEANSLAPLRRRHPDAEISVCTDYPSLPRLLEEHRPDALYTVRFAGTPGFPRRAILAAPSLRWVSVGGSGTDHLTPWDPQRLTVTNAAGVGAPTMAQYAIAAALHFNLGLPGFATAQRQRRWAPTAVASLEGLDDAEQSPRPGKTGQAVALAKAHGMQVIGLRARPAPTPSVDRVEPVARLGELLPEADFLSFCVPLTADTRGLMDAAAFARLKPGAVLVDVSRGGVVQQAALIEALGSGRLKGAALDVFETEPLPAEICGPWRM